MSQETKNAQAKEFAKINPNLIRSFILQNPEENEETALLFLQASKGSIDRALILFSRFEKQDATFQLRKTKITDIQEELLTGKIFPFPNSLDKYGCPYVYFDVSKHVPNKCPFEKTAKLIHFVIWNMLLQLPTSQERRGISLFVDLKNAEAKNLDNAAFAKIWSIFSKNYPCRISHIYLYKVSWTINAAEKVTCLLSPKLSKRIEKIDRWTDAMSMESAPTFAGGSAVFDLEAYLKGFSNLAEEQEQVNSPYSQSSSQSSERLKINSFEQIFSSPLTMRQPVAKKPNILVAPESFSSSLDNNNEDEESISFDQKEIAQKLEELDCEIEKYRQQFNTEQLPQSHSIASSPLESYNEWIEGEWMLALQKHQNLWGRRFSDTRYYEGKAYSVIEDGLADGARINKPKEQ